MATKRERINVHRRIDKIFANKFLDDIRAERLRMGKDKFPLSDTRITAAVRRHPQIRGIKSDIIKADLDRDTKDLKRR